MRLACVAIGMRVAATAVSNRSSERHVIPAAQVPHTAKKKAVRRQPMNVSHYPGVRATAHPTALSWLNRGHQPVFFQPVPNHVRLISQINPRREGAAEPRFQFGTSPEG